jgi:hypothetical protein
MTIARDFVKIQRSEHDGIPEFDVIVCHRRYHYKSEMQAVEEREWWIQTLEHFYADQCREMREAVKAR